MQLEVGAEAVDRNHGVEFDPLLAEPGSNAFTMSPTRWVELTSAIGIITKNGAGGGTYAQRDIAFKFANWVSVEFVHKRNPFVL